MIVLKGTKVNKTIDLNTTTPKVSIEMITCLIRMEALYRDIRRVKRALKIDTLNGLK